MTDHDQLPVGWEPITLGQIGDLHCGQSPSSQTVNGEGHGTLYVTGPEQWDGKRIRQGKWTTDPKRIVPEGCIFVTVKGAGVGTTFPGIACAIGRDVYAYQPSSGVSLDFVHEALQFTIQDVLRHARGDIPGLSRGHIVDHKIGLPPLNEQRRIVAKIEALMARSGRAKEALDAIPALLDRYRQSVLAAAFRGDLTADWRKHHPDTEPASELLEVIQKRLKARKSPRRQGYHVPEDQLKDLPSSWTWARMTGLADVSGGATKNPKRREMATQVPYLRVANVYANELRLEDVQRIGVTENELDGYRLQEGDLLIVEGNGSMEQIGRVAMWDGSITCCVHQNHIIKARVPDADVARYVLAWMLSPMGRKVIQIAASSTSGLHTLSISKVQGIPVPSPPLAEIREINLRVARLLAWVAGVTGQVAEGMRKLPTIDQSILAKAFRGELVPQDPDDEPASELLARIKAERAATGTPTRRRKQKSQAVEL